MESNCNQSKGPKKVGIITITGGANYGNRLQNYATQTILEELGLVVETINHNEADDCSNLAFSKRMMNKLNTLRGKRVGWILRKLFTTDYYQIFHRSRLRRLENARMGRFLQFNQQYIKYSRFKIENRKIPVGLSEYYDYFLCGSDQIWNPYYLAMADIYFLTFSNYEKNIAFAPSLGVADFPARLKATYRNWLANIKHLSVREKVGAAILEEITGRTVAVLIDPTLMLTRNQWLQIAWECRAKPKGKYILNYFLGKNKPSTEKQIKHIAQKYNMEVYNLQDSKNIEKYSVNPNEFIDLVKDASLVCTNSFHGTVFAIVMQVPFIVFERNSSEVAMNSRLDNLLALLNFQSRDAKRVFQAKEWIFKSDFGHAAQVLEVERNKAIRYLCNAFALKKDD
jgi:hypothetical protein